MQARQEDLDALLRLQQLDLDIMKQRKKLDELPQRDTILAVRKKREEVEAKRGQVSRLKKDASMRLSRINDEDDSLAKKSAGVQAALNATQGDYRNVESRSKELAGIEKRRAKLREDRAAVDAELEKISNVEAQIDLLDESLDAKEDQAIASFQKEGSQLKASVAELEDQRAGITADLPADLLKLYDKTLARVGCVPVGSLDGGRCSVCRAPIESGRLIDLRSQAPLGICPACKRLLIIE